LLALVIAYIELDALVGWQVRRQLAARLLPAATLDSITLRPFSGELDLRGLRIPQPHDFPGTALCELGRVQVAIDPLSLFSDTIQVSKVRVSDVTVRVVRRADGQFDLEQLLRPSPAAEAASLPSEKADPAPAKPRHCIIGSVGIERLSIELDDQVAGRTWVSAVNDIDVVIDGLALDLAPEFSLGLQRAVLWIAKANLQQAITWGPGDLVQVQMVEAELGPLTSLTSPINLRRFSIGTATFQAQRERDGRDSVVQTLDQVGDLLADLGQRLNPERKSNAPTTAPAVASGVDPVPATPFALHLGQFTLADGSLGIRDASLGEVPLILTATDLHIALHELNINPPSLVADPARLSVSCRLQQAANMPPALVGLLAECGPVSAAIPTLALRQEITGLHLDSLGPLLPSGARTALGGKALDARVALRLAPDTLDLAGQLRTEHGTAFPFTVRGSPSQPVVNLGPIVFAAMNRLGSTFTKFGGSVVGVGKEVVSGGAQAVTSLGSGAVHLGSKIGGGLFSAVKGLVTLDAGQVGDGLHQATVGSATSTLDTAKQTGSALGTGAGNSLSVAQGTPALQRWLEETPKRHAVAMAEAAEWLSHPPSR
jgi:hypothetical protein